MLPLYEAKMIHHFDHRFGTYEGQTEAQANMGTLPRLTPEQQDDPSFVGPATLLGRIRGRRSTKRLARRELGTQDWLLRLARHLPQHRRAHHDLLRHSARRSRQYASSMLSDSQRLGAACCANLRQLRARLRGSTEDRRNTSEVLHSSSSFLCFRPRLIDNQRPGIGQSVWRRGSADGFLN